MRGFKITTAVTLLMALAFTLIAVFAAKRAPTSGDDDFVHGVLSISAVTSLVMLGAGIATMAGEFRHGTCMPTFLISPRRSQMIVAKVITITGVGAALGAISFGL